MPRGGDVPGLQELFDKLLVDQGQTGSDSAVASGGAAHRSSAKVDLYFVVELWRCMGKREALEWLRGQQAQRRQSHMSVGSAGPSSGMNSAVSSPRGLSRQTSMGIETASVTSSAAASMATTAVLSGGFQVVHRVLPPATAAGVHVVGPAQPPRSGGTSPDNKARQRRGPAPSRSSVDMSGLMYTDAAHLVRDASTENFPDR